MGDDDEEKEEEEGEDEEEEVGRKKSTTFFCFNENVRQEASPFYGTTVWWPRPESIQFHQTKLRDC